MNLNQSATATRVRVHLRPPARIARLSSGTGEEGAGPGGVGRLGAGRVRLARCPGARVARFGDNMRQVAVTRRRQGPGPDPTRVFRDGFGVGDLVARVKPITDRRVDRLVSQYESAYRIAKAAGMTCSMRPLREAPASNCGMRTFLEEGGFKAFTTTFEDLHGLKQLPGLAVQAHGRRVRVRRRGVMEATAAWSGQ